MRRRRWTAPSQTTPLLTDAGGQEGQDSRPSRLVKFDATFVRSAAVAADFPRDSAAEIALVGRSNVGKSTLINALVRQRVARTSAEPGKTRLANIYRVERGVAAPLYLVDLPGYGYARGRDAAREFDAVTRAFFDRVRLTADATSGVRGVRGVRVQPDRVALLVVDARHPGLERDIAAWH